MDDSAYLKKRLREKILLIRQALATEQRKEYDEKIFHNLSSFLCKQKYAKAEKIAVYTPVHNEVNTSSILPWLIARGWQVALPKISGKQLIFSRWFRQSKMSPNRFGILEPAHTELIIPNIVVTPLVAFDHRKYRLGYGGGFYDRYFQQYPNIPKIGIAYECQKVSAIPYEENDAKLDSIITESQMY